MTRYFVEHIEGTGKIVRHGSCQDEVFDSIRPTENGIILEGRGMPETHKIVDGKIVNKTPREKGE